jgi:hypothetical protein
MVEAPKENQPPAMPNDPAIMGVSKNLPFDKYIGFCSCCKSALELWGHELRKPRC